MRSHCRWLESHCDHPHRYIRRHLLDERRAPTLRTVVRRHSQTFRSHSGTPPKSSPRMWASAAKCFCGVVANSRLHSKGIEIDMAATPRYLATLSRGGAIAAHDAQRDPRTSEFTADYLVPLRITSMLDASVLVDGSMRSSRSRFRSSGATFVRATSPANEEAGRARRASRCTRWAS